MPKFLAQFLNKWPAVLRTGWPDILQTLGASRVISKEYPTIILDVGETLKRFNVNSRIFFTLIFSLIFFLWENPAKMMENFGWIYNGILFSFQKDESNISILCKFQIYVEQSIFVVEKRLSYGKTSIFNEKYDATKIK